MTNPLSTFFKLFPKAVKDIQTGYRNRMVTACVNLMRDAQDEDPNTPIDTGALISSYSVFVDNELKALSPYRGGKAEPILSMRNNNEVGKKIVGTVAVGMDYALKVHDPAYGLKFKRPGAGPLFLALKVKKHEKLYKEISKGFADARRTR